MPVDMSQDCATWELAAQNSQTLRQVFTQIHAHSCPTDYNFHMHTVHSDGRLHPQAVIEQAIAIGLKGLAITDHHSVGGYRVAQSYLAHHRRKGNVQSLPILWTGVEINAKLHGVEVHILGYAFDPDHVALRPYLQGMPADDEQLHQADQVISAIQRAGGVAVLAHPARYRKPPESLIPVAARLGIDGVETYYAYANPSPWQPCKRQTHIVHNLAESFNLLHTCGTDTHGEDLLKRL